MVSSTQTSSSVFLYVADSSLLLGCLDLKKFCLTVTDHRLVSEDLLCTAYRQNVEFENLWVSIITYRVRTRFGHFRLGVLRILKNSRSIIVQTVLLMCPYDIRTSQRGIDGSKRFTALTIRSRIQRTNEISSPVIGILQ